MKNASAVLVAMALALAACDRGGEEQPQATGPAATVAPAGGAVRGSDAVRAVLQSQGTALAKLEFLIETRPVAGQPFAVKLQLSAAEPQPALQLMAESSAMAVAPESATLALEAANVPVTHELVVTAPKEGLAELIVRLKAGEAPETIYAIPVLIAAAGSPGG
jgi:hypothetical protein